MRSRPAAVLAFLAVLATACGGTDGGADAGVPAPDALATPEPDSGADPADGACVAPSVRDAFGPASDLPAADGPGDCTLPNLEGRFFRFSRFDVDQPAGPEGALGATLTSLWATEIAADQLNIVFHVVRHDPATGRMDIEAGTAVRLDAGAATGPRYRMLSDPPAGVLPVQVTGCTFRSCGAGTLPVFPDLLTVPLDILDTWVQGVFAADGSRIAQGTMVGGICRDMARAQFFKLTPEMSGCSNLDAFMTDVGVEADRDDLPCGPCSGAGYTFLGRFDAEAREDFDPQAGPAPHEFRCQ